MNTRVIFHLTLCLSGLIFPFFSAAGSLYKWQDDQGRWHFSDNPSSTVHSEDITEKLTPLNISDNAKSQQDLRKIFKGETLEEKTLRLKKEQQQAQQDALQQQACTQAKIRLEKLRGPVVFLDKNGNALDVSEKERDARTAILAAKIRQLCR